MSAVATATPAAPAPPPAPAAPPPRSPFFETRFRFTTGLRAGEVAAVRADDGRVLLSYRSFASAVGIVAALVSAIVALAGCAAVLFLIAEEALLRAMGTLVLTIGFAWLIATLVPRVNVTLYDHQQPALTMWQRRVFPSGTYLIAMPTGAVIAELRKSVFSRFGRNRWTIVQEGRYVGEAAEESFGRALMRKFLGKFSRSYETNVAITYGGIEAARIIRRPDAHGNMDLLEITSDTIDRRIAVAVATLVLGREP
jgi:hypothetical protein